MKTTSNPVMLLALAACLSCTALAARAETERAPLNQSVQEASQPTQPNQPNDGSDYIAAWSVMGDICRDKYPAMKPAVEEFWAKRWDKATREKVAEMKRSPEYLAKVEKHRKNLNARRDEIIEQCGRLFTGGAH